MRAHSRLHAGWLGFAKTEHCNIYVYCLWTLLDCAGAGPGI